MRNLEGSVQKAVVIWCRAHKNPILHRIFHVPNGEKRDVITAKRLKAQGVLAGVPDLCLPLPDNHVFWLELKKLKGKTSKVQKVLHANWESINHHVVVAYGFVEACKELDRVGLAYGGNK